jgi:hypothetical protein
VASGEAVAGGTTATHIKAYKLHEDEAKTVDAAIKKAKATSGTSVDSAALELICLDYLGRRCKSGWPCWVPKLWPRRSLPS